MAVQFYPAVIVSEGDGYGMVFPDFPGCVTVGATAADAARHAVEALALHVEGEAAEAIPSPSDIDAPLPEWAAGAADGVRVLVPVELPGRITRVNITFDEALLRRVDNAAEHAGFTRSGYLAQAAREKLMADAVRRTDGASSERDGGIAT